MIRSKSQYKSIQFIPKTNNDQPKDHLKKSSEKLSYDEIRKIVEHTSEKEIPGNHKEKHIKNKFDIV